MVISSGNSAKSGEVKPQLLTYARNLINLDKYEKLHHYNYDDFFADGFSDSILVGSSTNWATAGKQYFTSTNSAELISKTITFPSTISYATAYVDFIIADTYDECNDSSVSTSLWDTTTASSGTDNGSITEDTDTLNILSSGNSGGGSSVSSNAYVTTDNAVMTSTYTYLATKFAITTSTYDGSDTHSNKVYIQLTDGSNTVTCWSVEDSKGGSGQPAYLKYSNSIYDQEYSPGNIGQYPWGDAFGASTILIELFYNPDADIVYVYYDGRYYDRVDVSSVGDLKLRIRCDANTSQSAASNLDADTQCDVDWVRRNASSPSSSLATTISADGGSNYESATREEEHTFSNTGTQLKIKNTATISGTEHIHIRGYTVFMR